MNITEQILAKQDDSIAIFYGDTVYTYARLCGEVNDIAARLSARGYSQGDRIGILSENSPFFVVVYLAILRSGLVAVPLQHESTNESLLKIISNAGIRELFVSNRLFNRILPLAQETGVSLEAEGVGYVPCENLKSRANGRSTCDSPQLPPPDLAALMFTSGSTGTPKGVMITHQNIAANTTDIVSYMRLTSADRVMVVLPFYYCFALSLLHSHLMVGASLVLNNEFKLYPERTIRELARRECTGIAGVPSTFQLLLRRSRFANMSFPKLRWFQQAGGKLPNPYIRELREAFPDVRFFLMYGQTEGTARLSYLPPDRLDEKLGSVGKGLPSTTLEVLMPDGTAVKPGSDEIGEIVATGSNVSPGYWNDPAETTKFFRNGKLYTGDLAIVDDDGFIYIVDRERDIIKSGGNRVSAKEIEDVISEISDVVEVAVTAMPHHLLGEAIKAFVTLACGARTSSKDVQRHCRNRLPAFKVPNEVSVLEEMPHNSAGKIQKFQLNRGVLQPESPVNKPTTLLACNNNYTRT